MKRNIILNVSVSIMNFGFYTFAKAAQPGNILIRCVVSSQLGDTGLQQQAPGSYR